MNRSTSSVWRLRPGPLLALFLLSAAAAFAFDPARFPAYKELSPPAVRAGEVGAVTLDHDLYRRSDDALSGLRLVQREAREIPYGIRRTAATRSVAREMPFPADEVAAVRELPDNRLEIVVRRADDRPVPAGLRLHTALRNFEKRVTVSGGPDRAQWTVLVADAPLYDYARYMDVRHDKVLFPPRAFPWYKIEIAGAVTDRDSPLVEIVRQTGGAAGDLETVKTSFRKEPFHVERVEFVEISTRPEAGATETRTVLVADLDTTQDADGRRSLIVLTTARQPLIALTVRTDEANFSRAVTLEARDDAASKEWRTLVAGRISRVRAGPVSQDRLTLDLPHECRYRQYRLIVHHQDNPPLAVTGLEARENVYEALFFPKAGGPTRLYYGAIGGDAPQYDVDAVLQDVPPGAAEIWTAGGEQPNPAFQGTRRRWGGRAFFYGSMAMMIAVLVVLLRRTARGVAAVDRAWDEADRP